ncbi:MAG: L,D-transpeptidase [Myxococcales bacterium]|nr:L,D-transpeptidase [Myxococcales bacterium]MCB9579851.1 L,D-transpeptidase [Polyangiaceae bacterium]
MRRAVVTFALALFAAQIARADTLPWVDPGDVPLPSGVQSVEIVRADEPLLVRPRGQAARRGSAAEHAHLPLYGATRGPGCPGRWLSVGPLAWVCETGVRLSFVPALSANAARESFGDGLPYRYHFVGQNGSLGYVNLRTAEDIAPDAELQPGFAVAVVEVARKGNESYGLTTHGLWLPMRDLNPARRFAFHGEDLDGDVNVGWVYEKSARVYEKPGGRRSDEVHAEFEALRILETKERAKHRWFRIGEGRWVNDHEVRAPTPTTRPPEVGEHERWIDVEIDNQVLVAYEGDRPVFGTLVSTGRGKGKSIQATPKGTHRIWVKLRSSDMTNLQDQEASRYYAIEDVPWVMYFKKGYGLHGTFWHRSFGHVKSHGCVNLAPLDAERLFHWTSPRVPAGWTAALPTEYEPGTVIRVR